MATEFSFKFPLPGGLHARPASAFEAAARPFASEITFINDRTGAQACVRSVLGMVSTGTLFGDACRIICEGVDEARAREALARFVAERLPSSDDPSLESSAVSAETNLPRCLRDSGAVLWKVKSAVPGIGAGHLVCVPAADVPPNDNPPASTDSTLERERLLNALLALDRTYAERLKKSTDKVSSGLLQAHRAMARDPALKAWMLKAMDERKLPAINTVTAASEYFSSLFANSASVLLRERALDIRDVCRQLLRELNSSPPGPPIELARDSIVAAEGLTPSDLLALDRRFLKGLALNKVGGTSHTVILAQSFGIPCVIETSDFPVARWEGQEAIVDGESGLLAVGLTPGARRYYEMEQSRLDARKARTRRLASLPGSTSDGARLEIAANISSPDESAQAIASGAEGVGLFRTEMLFMDRSEPPGEEEQFEAYSNALRGADGRSVIIRALDIGGDKSVPWLKLPSEDNPMLGLRGARLYPRIEPILRAQVRALLRASPAGRLRVMFPMIAQISEARWVKNIFDDERAKLAAKGTPMNSVPLGAMIEIPVAAFELAALCHELDFFSIGSNDLIHYFTATDRGATTALDDPLAPSFVRLLKKIIDDAHAASRWIGLCGEIGANLQCLPIFVGLGLDEISVPLGKISAIKDQLALLVASECRRLVAEILECATSDEVRNVMQQREVRRPTPVLAEELVVLDRPTATKAEAIKVLCDMLYVAGRIDSNSQVENAVWSREDDYSTGIGHGLAIPHCKSSAVAATSLCVLRSQEPIPWQADGAPVNIVILLAIRDDDHAPEQMKIITRLAQSLMDESFRENLAGATTEAAVAEIVATQLGLPAVKNQPSPVLNLEV